LPKRQQRLWIKIHLTRAWRVQDRTNWVGVSHGPSHSSFQVLLILTPGVTTDAIDVPMNCLVYINTHALHNYNALTSWSSVSYEDRNKGLWCLCWNSHRLVNAKCQTSHQRDILWIAHISMTMAHMTIIVTQLCTVQIDRM
jgi:hypothetical protein